MVSLATFFWFSTRFSSRTWGQEPPRAARSSQGPSGAARGQQKPPGAGRSSQRPPRTASSSQGPAWVAKSSKGTRGHQAAGGRQARSHQKSRQERGAARSSKEPPRTARGQPWAASGRKGTRVAAARGRQGPESLVKKTPEKLSLSLFINGFHLERKQNKLQRRLVSNI